MPEYQGLILTPGKPAQVSLIEIDDLHVLIGGYLECIMLSNCHAYLDEEGKLKGLQWNAFATILAHALGWRSSGVDYLVGPVVFLGNGPAGQESDLPEEVIKKGKKMFSLLEGNCE